MLMQAIADMTCLGVTFHISSVVPGAVVQTVCMGVLIFYIMCLSV